MIEQMLERKEKKVEYIELIFRKNMMINIAITVIYIFSVYFILHHFANKTKKEILL